MTVKLILVIFSVLIFSCAMASDGIENNKKAINALREMGITIDIDNNMSVVGVSPVEDFMLFTFSTNKKILNAYVGNQPNFPGMDISEAKFVLSNTTGDLKVNCYQWIDNLLYSGQCLVDMAKKKNFPQYIHFSYSKISKSEMQIVQKIILSVKIIDSDN